MATSATFPIRLAALPLVVALGACLTDPPTAPSSVAIRPTTLAKATQPTCDIADYPDPLPGWPNKRRELRQSLTARAPNSSTAIILIHGLQPNVLDCKTFAGGESGEEYFQQLLPVI